MTVIHWKKSDKCTKGSKLIKKLFRTFVNLVVNVNQQIATNKADNRGLM